MGTSGISDPLLLALIPLLLAFTARLTRLECAVERV